MDPWALILSLATDYTLRTVAIGSAIIGCLSGALGAFALLRRQSLLGDAMAHAALPGVCGAFLLTGSKAPLSLMLGAGAAALTSALVTNAITRSSRIKGDTAMAIVLSVFFGFGLLLLTFIQKFPNAAQAGLDSFLFGQAAALLERDVVVMGALAIVAIAGLTLLWKELKLLTFDPEFGASLGYPMHWLDVALIVLTVVAIVVGLQTVGVVLMTALIVAPAAAARQWTNDLAKMVWLSAGFGVLAGVSGAVISSTTTRLPTGPTIVLCAAVIVVFSLAFAPNRGLLIAWGRRQRRPDATAELG